MVENVNRRICILGLKLTVAFRSAKAGATFAERKATKSRAAFAERKATKSRATFAERKATKSRAAFTERKATKRHALKSSHGREFCFIPILFTFEREGHGSPDPFELDGESGWIPAKSAPICAGL